LGDPGFDFLNRDAFATVQFVQTLLDGLAKLQLGYQNATASSRGLIFCRPSGAWDFLDERTHG
jgi:hypothetical protein